MLLTLSGDNQHCLPLIFVKVAHSYPGVQSREVILSIHFQHERLGWPIGSESLIAGPKKGQR